MSKPLPPNSLVCVYAQLLPVLRECAKSHGYALGLHGSMVRDLDLIAAPWIEEASSAEDLIAALASCCGGFIPEGRMDGTWDTGTWDTGPGTEKPHGRRGWTICFGGKPFIDVSVMPLSRKARDPREGNPLSRLKLALEQGLMDDSELSEHSGLVTVRRDDLEAFLRNFRC